MTILDIDPDMLTLACQIPDSVYVACSGGLDSMTVLNFLTNSKRDIAVVHIDHGTIHAADAKSFVMRESSRLGIPSRFFPINKAKGPNESDEEHWRNERYRIFKSLDRPVVTAHTLNDAMEWWIMSSLHGTSKLIPVKNENVIRPFLTVLRREIEDWAQRKEVRHIEDPSNKSREYMRNIVRHDILRYAMKVNPGFDTLIRKKYGVNTDRHRGWADL